MTSCKHWLFMEEHLRQSIFVNKHAECSPLSIKVLAITLPPGISWPFQRRWLVKHELQDEALRLVSSVLEYNSLPFVELAASYSNILFFWGGAVFFQFANPKEILAVVFRPKKKQLKEDLQSFLRMAARTCILMPGKGRSVLIHAASIDDGGKGCIFPGKSGSGKSTICMLSKNKRIIHDDIALISINDKEELKLSSFFAPAENVPLKQVFFIKQDTRHRLKRISVNQGMRLGLPHVMTLEGMFPYLSSFEDTVDTALQVFKSVSCFELDFRKDNKFWALIDALA